MSVRGQACAYCGAPATGADHVIPKAIRKHYTEHVRLATKWIKRCTIPEELLGTVPCCLKCNVNKSTRKLVPPSWADKVVAIREVVPGDWRVWHGSLMEPAFREVHV